jgi:hypothetical protein
MSNAPQSGTPSAAASATQAPKKREILIVSHCTLFYWWPVWAIGSLMFVITWATGDYMVTVHPKTVASISLTNEKGEKREGYELPQSVTIPRTENGLPEQPHLWMTSNKRLGVYFSLVLLLVIVITNIPLRGLWSVIVIVIIISTIIILSVLEAWNKILGTLSLLDIRINAAGYLVISASLFILWLVVILVFDRQIYMVFTPGQMRVKQEIGDAETAMDTTGMTVQKQRSDFFRHWVLGLGSGDLIVRTHGANPQEFHMNNVLFIGRKVKEIEEMLRTKDVITTNA